MSKNNGDSQINKFNRWTARASSNSNGMFSYRKNCEEFFYSDVGNTLTQFTERQLNAIQATYNIPVSTKISYALIEQLLAFITSSKPFPRLLSSSPKTAEWTAELSKGYQGVWYESKANRELKNALRDALVSGSGYLLVRKNSFLDETTFNTVIEYTHWKHILVDPDSRKEDFSDAEYIINIDFMPKYKAEKRFDITISEDADYNMPAGFQFTNGLFDGIDTNQGSGIYNANHKEKFVLIREIFYREEINVYISDEGDVSTKRPEPVEIPNKEKESMLAEISQMQSLATESTVLAKESIANNPIDDIPRVYEDNDDMAMSESTIVNNRQLGQEMSGEAEDMTNQINAKLAEAEQLPDTLPGFEMTLRDKSIIIINSYTKLKKKRIRRIVLVGDKKVEDEYLQTDNYPIIHVTFCHNNSPNKTYGIIHFIIDLVKAMNKSIASTLYDMQINNNRKILAPKGAVEEPTQFETKWAEPGSYNEYVPNPSLPNGGEPKVIDPAPISQNFSYLMQFFQQLIEYITGVNSVMQGNPQEAPVSMGGIQSLQAFGAQRVKSFARTLESSLEQLALVTVSYLIAYAPKDEWLTYFDEDGNGENVRFLNQADDLQFKVRVDIVNSLPTQKQLLATLLGSVAGQTKNPVVADALTKTMLDLIEDPNVKKLSGQIDTLKQMEQQAQQLQQQLDDSQNRIDYLENQLFQKELSYKVAMEFEKMRGNVKAAESKAKAEVQSATENGNPMDAIQNIDGVHMSDIEQRQADEQQQKQFAQDFSNIPE